MILRTIPLDEVSEWYLKCHKKCKLSLHGEIILSVGIFGLVPAWLRSMLRGLLHIERPSRVLLGGKLLQIVPEY